MEAFEKGRVGARAQDHESGHLDVGNYSTAVTVSSSRPRTSGKHKREGARYALLCSVFRKFRLTFEAVSRVVSNEIRHTRESNPSPSTSFPARRL